MDPGVLNYMLIKWFDFSLRKQRVNTTMARKKACDIQPEVLDRGKKTLAMLYIAWSNFIWLTQETLPSQLRSALDTLSDSRGWSCFISLQLFWLSWLSAKHLATLAWPKDAIRINQLKEIGMVPTSPCLILQVIICACMLQIPAAAHSPVRSHNGPLAWRDGESWNMELPTWFIQMFRIISLQTENCCKAQHTCIFFLPSACRDSSEFSVSHLLPHHSTQRFQLEEQRLFTLFPQFAMNS